MDFGLYNVSMDDKTTQIHRTENPSFRFLIMIDCFRFQKIASWLYAFAPNKNSSSPAVSEALKSDDHRVEEERLSREEMKSVMGNLGLVCAEESEESLPLFGSIGEVWKLFDERSPCVAEVKEAFDVFDVNGDGFIDVGELKRVLCALGLKEGEGIENCRRMIKKFDENEDGRIDFQEFVKLMESVV